MSRVKAPEAVTMHLLNEIRAMRRRDVDKKDKFRLEGEDMREDQELRRFVIERLARDVSRLLISSLRSDAEAQKAAERRTETAWADTGNQTQQTE